MSFIRKKIRKTRMRTDFSFACAQKKTREREARRFVKLIKKALLSTLCATCVLFTAFSCFYAVQTSRAQEIVLNKSFYFLAAEGKNAQACIAAAQLYGGAGYALTYDEKEYAVYACYAEESKAESAKESLLKNGEKAVILPRRCRAIYLRTRSQKARNKEITGWFCSLEDCAEALRFCIEGAENGKFSQSALKNAAESIGDVLRALSKRVTSDSDKRAANCAQACETYCKELKKIAESIVYARDLRKIHAGLCDEYIRLASAYAI